MGKIISFDIETTGLDPVNDEILQIAIVDENCRTLFNNTFKPSKLTIWGSAEKIHGISPKVVDSSPKVESYVGILNSIFASSTKAIGYNITNFDIKFLEKIGVKINCNIEDVMIKFSRVYGKWNDYYKNYQYMPLKTCADYYGVAFNAHDALSDACATMSCYRKMI